ncbi:hypothetical protein ACROYT_G009725 [Oculina patagonica]
MEMDEAEHFEESSKKRSSKENKSYEFDDLLRLTGGFGRYQMALYVFICLVSIPTGAQLLVQVFYGASPRFNCIAVSGNQTCDPGKCCSNCQKYEFQGPFTSAVSECHNMVSSLLPAVSSVATSSGQGSPLCSQFTTTGDPREGMVWLNGWFDSEPPPKHQQKETRL